MPLDDWLASFEPRTSAQEPLPPERRPARIAFEERRASHLGYRITGADGVERDIEVTAFPLFAHTDEFVGIVGSSGASEGMSSRLKIWGCRGSVPTPGADTVKYGGNTSCVEVVLDDDTALVFDAGTGIRALGADLARRGTRHIHLFLTHLHLDHLEGLRFFAPLWNPAVTLEIWGPCSPVVSLRERIMRGFSPPLFPLDFRDVPAHVTFHDLPGEPWRRDGATLFADLVLHPGPRSASGSERRRVSRLRAGPRAGARRHRRQDDRLAFRGRARTRRRLPPARLADPRARYPAKIGWGHSSVADAVAFSRAVGARRLVLFHHEPERSDDGLESLLGRARDLANGNEAPVLAREGMLIEVG